MVKKLLFVFLATLLLSGCPGGLSGSGTNGPTKTYALEGGKATFTTPPSPWEEKLGVTGENDSTLGAEKGEAVGVSFHRPEAEGFFAVGTMEQNNQPQVDAKGKTTGRQYIELENDQETLDMIAFWVVKRDGKILKQDYIPIAGTKAFWMEFELGKPDSRMKGQQAHFTRDGTHWTLSMLIPVKEYDAEVKHFRSMISSFQLEPEKRQGAQANAKPSP